MNLKKFVLLTALFVLMNSGFAMVSNPIPQITPRHFTIVPPFTITSIEAYTNIPNFSVQKTSENTFDLYFDYIYPTPLSHGSIKLWVMNGKDLNYAWFVSDEIGIQFLECIGCPQVIKTDSKNYQFKFE